MNHNPTTTFTSTQNVLVTTSFVTASTLQPSLAVFFPLGEGGGVSILGFALVTTIALGNPLNAETQTLRLTKKQNA